MIVGTGMPYPNAVKLPLAFDAAALRADLTALQPGEWVRHFNTGYYDGDWTAVSLRSTSGSAGQIFPSPVAADYLDTPVVTRCPALAAALARFQCPLLCVRLLSLSSGSRIKEHSDYDLSVEDGEVRIHIPVQTNPHLEFYLDSERVTMAEGEAWYLNLNRKHRVFNGGETERIHLVVDCKVNDWILELLAPHATA
ncbi:MAG: aspartyl/asparaginyl beta-hydroxylase domain-containing protein [Acidobacteria bacterium]|nr:aspartyl/asparaginyl beta-hydroxylase domain-containing protein [Acidobacteriota bacterium]